MGYKNRKPFIITTYYKTLVSFLNFLDKYGFIQSYQILPNHKLKIHLKYMDDTPAIAYLHTISTPTYKVYKTYEDLFYEKNKASITKNKMFHKNETHTLKKSLESFHFNQLSFLSSMHNEHSMNYIISPYKKHMIQMQSVYTRPSIYHTTLNSYDKLFQHDAFFILSTSQGFMTHHEAFLKRLGGLLICQIY